MKGKYIFLFVLLVVLFALSSCGESGTKSSSSALGDRTLVYEDVAVVVNDSVSVSPKWTSALTRPNDVTYTISPEGLPTGLTFDTKTGIISGNPTDATAPGEYTITATAKNPGAYTGTQTSNTVRITILFSRNLADYGFSYSTEAISVAVDAPANASPKWTTALELPGNVSYSIENADGSTPLSLPEGLTFEGDTGVITGKPKAALATQQYTITATGSAPYTGEPEASISIMIVATNDISGYAFSYNEGKPLTGTVGEEITELVPSWPTELDPLPALTYSITPALPEGLSLNDAGVITGTPSEAKAGKTYTITATATGTYTGTQTTTISIVINRALGHKFTYPIATGLPSEINVSPAWETTPPTGLTYTVTPDLPSGLRIDNTGKISGSFANLQHGGAYTVTATSDSGNATAVFFTLVLDEYTTDTTGSTAIDSRDKLKGMDRNGTYHLTKHIDLGTGSWDPLFSDVEPFIGTLDGNGYAIYNLHIKGTNSDNYQGLFAALGSGATVKNLGIAVGKITSGAAIGALAGQAVRSSLTNITSTAMSTPASGTASIASNGSIVMFTPQTYFLRGSYTGGLVGLLDPDSTLIGNSIGLSISASNRYVGGLVGKNEGGIVTGYATGAVTGISHIGGLVGGNAGTVTGYTSSDLSGEGSIGGLVGYNESATVTGYATGTISAKDNYIGGLVGYNANATVTGYATGAVTGISHIGGLVGHSSGTVRGYASGDVTGNSYVGGLVGWNSGTISGYALGDVTGSVDNGRLIGGLVGLTHKGPVAGYALGDVKGVTDVGGLVGKIGGLAGDTQGTVTGYATGAVSGTGEKVGGLVGYNEKGIATGYATGTVTGGKYLGGLVGYNEKSTSGYWDRASTQQSAGTGAGPLDGGAGIRATRYIVYADPAYTDGGITIFDATAFTGAFDIASGANKTWPKLKVGDGFAITYDGNTKIPLVQATVRDIRGNNGAGDGIIEVYMPEQEKFPEGWPFRN